MANTKKVKLGKRTLGSPAILVGVVLTVVGVGALILIISHALTPTVALEAENGTLNGATAITDSSASGGKAIRFGSTNSACSGTNVMPASNVVSVVANAATNTTICFAAGTYRLSAPIVPKAGQTLWGAPGAILDGSIVLASANWVASGVTWYYSGVLPAAYTGNGQCEDNATNPCLLREQVFRNGAHLTRVMSLAAVTSGTFYEDYAANRVYIGDTPVGQTVEMSKTAAAINSTASGVTIKGFTIQHFASNGQSGALIAGGTSWTITGNTAQWNHALGIYLSGSDSSTVTNNKILNNGQLGMGQYNSHLVTVSNNEFANNNTDGFWIADWESGGYKATKSSVVMSGNNVHDNKGVGIWFDVDCKDDTVDKNTITNNAADGVRFEISYNGTISNNTVTGNGLGLGRGGGVSIYSSAGINVNTSSNVDIFGNTVTNNLNGIGLQARDRGTGIYGLWELINNTVHDNTITQKIGSAYGEGATGLVQNVSNNAYFTSKGNSFTHNTYHLDVLSAKRFAWNNTYMDKTSWQAAGQDTTGTFGL